MFDMIFVALLQTVAGAPAQTTPPAPAAIEEPASAGETPEAEQAPDAEAPPAEQQYREERVCERLQVSTGERMPRRRCRTVRVPIEPGEQPAQQPAPQ